MIKGKSHSGCSRELQEVVTYVRLRLPGPVIPRLARQVVAAVQASTRCTSRGFTRTWVVPWSRLRPHSWREPVVRAARARAREIAWAQAAETGRPIASTLGAHTIPGVVLDVDATIVICHSDKEKADRTWKKTYGFHPLLCFLDATAKP